ncbi:MAG: VWA domain-containing protein [Planctomycetes bacterium]|nr:VWA domain-containing protein [Planctomycetota bacterium]
MSRSLRASTIFAVVATCVVWGSRSLVAGPEDGDPPTVAGPFPSEQSTCVCAGSVQFSVAASGGTGLSYQWRRGGVDLIDGLNYSGANTSTLTILNITTTDAGTNYRCVVTDSGGSTISEAATLIVNAALPGDFDHDCDVDSEDSELFDECLSGPGVPASSGCDEQDFDDDGDVDMSDFGFLQRSYGSQGQPAVIVPRDVVFVLDLSSSMRLESSLAQVNRIEIANRGIWAHLWDTQWGDPPSEGGAPAGPYLGNMNTWGDTTAGPAGINVDDPGLVYLPRFQNWTLSSAWTSQTLASQGFGAYTATEMAVINSSATDSEVGAYKRRVQVALGLVRWKSGKAGGQPGGDGDNVIDSSEVEALVPYPSEPVNPVSFCKQVGGSWSSYIDHVLSGNSPMSVYDPDAGQYGDPNCRYRYGLKTWLEFVLTCHPSNSESPGLAGSPEQPMQTMVDAVRTQLCIIQAQQGDDQVGMASFGTYGYGPAEKPDHMSWLTGDLDLVASRAGALQAAMWTVFSNTAEGIDKGVGVLFSSPEARPGAAKIMILLTDGYATCTRPPVVYDPSQAQEDAETAAQEAAALGVMVHTIGVGKAAIDPALQNWLASLAAISGGEFCIASGDPATYQAQLQDMLWQADPCGNAP